MILIVRIVADGDEIDPRMNSCASPLADMLQLVHVFTVRAWGKSTFIRIITRLHPQDRPPLTDRLARAFTDCPASGILEGCRAPFAGNPLRRRSW